MATAWLLPIPERIRFLWKEGGLNAERGTFGYRFVDVVETEETDRGGENYGGGMMVGRVVMVMHLITWGL